MNQSENNQLNEPPVPQKQIWMLGFFDVLGFSARVKNENIDKIYEDYENLIKRVLSNHEIDTTGMIVPTFMGGSLFSAGGKVEINYTYFSDTILLWAPLLPMYPRLFLQRCTDIMCESLLMKIPLRGAISVGKGYMHKRTGIYLGEHIVDAAKLESMQEHIGVAMTMSAGQSILIPASHPTQIIEYYTPIKENAQYPEIWSPIALDWPRRWRDRNCGNLIQHLEQLKPQNEAVSKYYDNAIKFVNWSEQYNDWHNDPDKGADFKHLVCKEITALPKQWTNTRALVRLVRR